jgi:hypothetical protein
MTDESDRIDEGGVRWEGTRKELEVWKRYKKTKAVSFVERGYSVSWYPDGDNWMQVYLPERHHAKAPEMLAEVKFYGHASKYGIDGGMVSKLSITETRTDLAAYVLGRPWKRSRVLYNYDRGPDVNRLRTSPEALRLYGAVLEELN